MTKISIIIPARNEKFLGATVDDLVKNAGGDVEVIAVLDGYWPDPPLSDHKNLKIIHRTTPKGMRNAINSAAAIASGDYLMKCDAHCAFGENYDEILKADCDKDWVVIPSRYSLAYDYWGIADNGKARVDYHFLSCPWTNPDGFSMHGAVWNDRARKRLDILIDEEMSFQGSCWFMHRDHFFKFLEGMSEEGYGSFTQEPQEIGMKTWLGGGKIMVNKKTWYAHLHKGKVWGRGYALPRGETASGHEYSAKFWTTNQWAKRVHDYDWLIDKFSPVPTWPSNWKEQFGYGT